MFLKSVSFHSVGILLSLVFDVSFDLSLEAEARMGMQQMSFIVAELGPPSVG